MHIKQLQFSVVEQGFRGSISGMPSSGERVREGLVICKHALAPRAFHAENCRANRILAGREREGREDLRPAGPSA